MKLTEFSAIGFRCLENIPLTPLSDLSILTGQNDGGKTSFLKAVELLLNPRDQPDVNDYTKKASGLEYQYVFCVGSFMLSPQEITQLGQQSNNIKLMKVCEREDRSIKYYFETLTFPGDNRLNANLTSTPIGVLRQILVDHSIPFTGDSRIKVQVISAIQAWLSTQSLVSGWKEADSTLLNMLPKVISFHSNDALNPQNEVTQTLRQYFKAQITESRYSGTLSAIETQMKTEMESELQGFENIVKRYCDDVDHIIIDPQFDFSNGFRDTDLYIQIEQDSPQLVDGIGDGRKRKITLAVHEWRKDIFTNPSLGSNNNVLIMYDEPDVHLDYQSQRQIIEIIKKIANVASNSVIVATHSLNIIDRIPITNIVHFESDERKTKINLLQATDPLLIDQFLYGINDNMGMKNSVLLNEKCFYIVEGATEFNALPAIYLKEYEHSLQAAGIRLWDGEGCTSVKLVAKFLNNNQRNVVFLLDEDTKTRTDRTFTQSQLITDGFDIANQITFIGAVEFEDAFPDNLYLRIVSKYYPKRSGAPWVLNDISSLRGASFTNDLLRTISGEVGARVTKPQMGMRIGKEILKNEIPQKIKDSFAQVDRFLS